MPDGRWCCLSLPLARLCESRPDWMLGKTGTRSTSPGVAAKLSLSVSSPLPHTDPRPPPALWASTCPSQSPESVLNLPSALLPPGITPAVMGNVTTSQNTEVHLGFFRQGHWGSEPRGAGGQAGGGLGRVILRKECTHGSQTLRALSH